ncbi:hypothetical protein J6590_091022 [Homalodisca vitripennis]|nr:hypothetical protein J6590_091022 [Homalodisca vitripennis]
MSGCKRTRSLRLNLRYLSVWVRNIELPDDTRVLSNSDKKVPGVAREEILHQNMNRKTSLQVSNRTRITYSDYLPTQICKGVFLVQDKTLSSSFCVNYV